MAGGLFVDKPFHPNIKCIIFSAVIISAYYFSTSSFNPLMTIPIFIVSYVSMAWYDYLYNCDAVMHTGSAAISPGTLDSIFKPNQVLEKQSRAYKKKTYLFHLLAVAPLLIYVGYKGQDSDKRIYPVLLSSGLIAGLYHGFRFFFSL